MNRKLVIWLSLIVAVLMVGCTGGGTSGGGNSSSAGGSPEDGAKAYLNAVLGGQGDGSSLLCSTLPDATKQSMQQAFDTMKSTYAATGATLDISGLTYTSHDVSGDTAQVDVEGKIKVTANGNSQEVDYPKSTIQMKNENGWKVCG